MGNTVWPGLKGETGATSPDPRADEAEDVGALSGVTGLETSCGLFASLLLSVLSSGVELLRASLSFFPVLSTDSVRPGCGETELQELGLPVRGVTGLQVALGTRKPDLSPPVSFLSDDLEYGLKLDLSSAPMSLIFSGLDLLSLSETTAESLVEDGGSDFPIWEHVCARRASGLFLASNCENRQF